MLKCHNRDCFYKYVTADVAVNILSNLQVKCSSPLLFNDPFDSQMEIQYDVTSSEELIKKTTGKICELMKPLLKNANINEVHKLVFNEIMTDPKFINDRHTAFERFYPWINKKIIEFAESDRLFCVSEKKDNLLMWAHYANAHQGAVIQFRCIPEENTGLCAAKPVRYSDKLPLLTIEDFLKGDQAICEYILNEMLLTKSRDWEYESEWRVILDKQDLNKDYDLRGIFEDELEAVYLGCRMSQGDKKKIIDITKTKHKMMKIFESFKDKQKFKLIFKEYIDPALG